MIDVSSGRRPGTAVLSWVISGFGALSAAGFFVWTVWFAAILDVTDVLIGFVTVAVPALGLVWGGYRLERSDVEPDRYERIFEWSLGGGIGFLAINALVIVFYPWYTFAGNIAWAHSSLNAGAVAGFAVGYVEARAIQREVEATAAAVRAERLAEEREVLTYLNDLLRHEVLNGAQIIGGHASLLLETVDDPKRRDRLETIDRQSDALTDVIDDVRAMLDANRRDVGVVDLGEILTAEVTRLQRRFDDVVVEAEIPDSAFVSGNEGLRWLFSNLLENAIEHNDSDVPRIDVSVETSPETVAVTIADDGPGIPSERRDRLFERNSENHGLGLYLVSILADRYGGDVELSETGPDGTAFTVTLPRATADDERIDERRAATATERDEADSIASPGVDPNRPGH